ncbi:MAG TPA: AraC family transcriptional regulator [Rhizomicrobium sp.]|jgi:AraC-like DNA-binding protein
MKFPPPDFRYLRFWTREYPPHQRLDTWRDVLAQLLLNTELQSLSEEPFQVDASLRALAGIRFGWGSFTPSIHRRSREIVAADNDDLLFIVNLEGPLSVVLDGRELPVRERDACLLSCRQEFDMVFHAAGEALVARIERGMLAAQVPDVDGFLGQPILRGNEALWLLTTYLRDLDGKQELATEALRRLVVAHVFNLLALTLNSSRQGDARDLGENALRLHAVRRYILAHLAEQELAIGPVARANGLSPRQLQRLFEATGTTFSEFLLQQRLQSVYAALIDPEHEHRSVSEIALASGFGDVSYFNRAFRKQYDKSPSEVRRSAQSSALAVAAV